jgi:pimeloyl-ACP methyl ester carboxylesterase
MSSKLEVPPSLYAEDGVQYVSVGRGRSIAYEIAGHPKGFPVFMMHGMPGSRIGIRPHGIVLHRMGVRLISYDRPGYGESDRHEGRKVVDDAAYVDAIAPLQKHGSTLCNIGLF